MNFSNPGLMQDFRLTLPTLLEHAATNHAQTEVVARLQDGSIFRYTYADLADRSRQAANALTRLGVNYGDVVGTLAWNHHWHMECFYAISGIGAVCHTVNPRLFEEQIVYIINHAQDTVLMVDQDFIELAERIVDDIPNIRQFIILGARGCVEEDSSFRFRRPWQHHSRDHSSMARVLVGYARSGSPSGCGDWIRRYQQCCL